MPLRVPTLDAPSVAPTELYQQTSPGPTRQADGQVAQALEGLGQQIERTGGQVAAKLERVKKQADETKYLEADTALDNAYTKGFVGDDGAPGFLSTRGESAHAQSRATMDGLEKARQDISSKVLATPEQRREWLARSQRVMSQALRTTEGHVAQQFQVATKDALEAKKAAVLKQAGSGIISDPAFMAPIEAGVRTLQTSKEDGDAELSDFRAKVAGAQIGQALSKEDLAHAEKTLSESKQDMGPDLARHVEYQIAQAKRGLEGDGKAEQDAAAARAMVDGLRQDDTYVDRSKALLAIEKLPLGVQAKARDLLQAEEKRKQEDTDRLKAQARGIYNSTGSTRAIPAALMEKLNGHANKDGTWHEGLDPDYWARLKDDEEQKWRRYKTNSRDDKRAQSEADILAINQYRGLDTWMQVQTNPEDFALGRGVSQNALAVMGIDQKHAIESTNKGDAHDRDSFIMDARSKGAALFVAPKGKKAPLPEAERVTYLGELSDQYREFVKREKRNPTADEKQAMISKAVAAGVRKVPGRLWGTNDVKQFGFQAAHEERLQRESQAPVSAPVKMRFPGSDADIDVPYEKVPMALRKGGVVVHE